jgi:acyl-CoA dehydrogenase
MKTIFQSAEYPRGPDFSERRPLPVQPGQTRSLRSVSRLRPIFEAFRDLPNTGHFLRQAEILRELLEKAGPDKTQDLDPVFSLPLGEMFSIVVYGQLILEQAQLEHLDPDILNQIFDFMVRDFARFALQIYGLPNCRDEQRAFCREIMLIRPVGDAAQYRQVWEKVVLPLNGEYAMNE